MVFDVGRVCIKTTGKEKGKVCVVVGDLEGNFVMVDGLVKRRRSNVAHLEALGMTIRVSKSMPKEDILKKLVEIHAIAEIPKKKEIKKSEKTEEKPKKAEKKKEKKPAKKTSKKNVKKK